MKKTTLLAAIIMMIAVSFVAPTQVNAQRVTTLAPTAVNDTLTNADTAWVYISTGLGSNTSAIIEPDARSVEARLTKLSGTAAGSITLEGTIDGTNWVTVSTDTFTNVTTNIKVYSLRNSVGDLQYPQYRMVFITSGTVSAIPKVFYLKRGS